MYTKDTNYYIVILVLILVFTGILLYMMYLKDDGCSKRSGELCQTIVPTCSNEKSNDCYNDCNKATNDCYNDCDPEDKDCISKCYEMKYRCYTNCLGV